MDKFTRADLLSLEEYARQRNAFRARAMQHKEHRRLAIGPHATLYFEDRLTIQYQIQEMLRIERTFEEAGIEDELAVYNPLIPDGCNWKATFMLEYADRAERARELARLVGVEHRVWLRVGGGNPIRAVADEDLDRATQDKTSAVHFLRFELGGPDIAALKGGAPLAAGIDHDHYCHTVDPVDPDIRESLIADLD